MGIVERELANFEIDNKEYRVELNENNVIHIHRDDIRFDLTLEEFKEFVKTVLAGKNSLEEIKDG